MRLFDTGQIRYITMITMIQDDMEGGYWRRATADSSSEWSGD